MREAILQEAAARADGEKRATRLHGPTHTQQAVGRRIGARLQQVHAVRVWQRRFEEAVEAPDAWKYAIDCGVIQVGPRQWEYH